MTEQVQSRRPRWWTVALGVLSGVIVATALGGAVVGIRLGSNVNALDISSITGRENLPKSIVDDEGNYTAVNILLMGSDTRQGEGNNKGYGNPDEFSNDRSDTTILLHVSADRSRALAVSFPRDTWVTLPTCNKDGREVGDFENKFNAAYELAGPGCTVKLVEQETGVTVDHFAVIDFAGFKRVVDAMDGVEVCLTKAVNDEKSGLNLPAGTQTVYGEDALAFVRARKTLSDGSDLARIQRQQSFLSSMIRKATSNQLLLNPVALLGVLDAGTKSLTTDPFLADLDNMRDLALSMRNLKPSDITFITVPWKPRGDNENVLIEQEKAASIWDAIKNDTPWPPKAENGQPKLVAAPSDIKVRVLNGSGVTGMAKTAAADLQKLGFQVVEVGNADRSDYASSVVQHDPNWDESGKTLTWTVVGATAEPTDGLGNTLTLIVGKDYSGVREPRISAGDTSAPTTADTVKCA